jgi:hypothetical protein
MPDEMEKLIRELRRDTEIVALLKTESATNVCLQGLVLQLLWLLGITAVQGF